MSLAEYKLLLSISKWLMQGECAHKLHVMSDSELDERSKRHANFFAGLTPQQEYDLHTKRRKEMDNE